jgi:lipopolysaccharide/colanic/teichoic acid biosynthesis glycosyltransferase
MGRRFRIFKFRTMKVNAEIASHQGHLKDLITSNTPMTKMDSKGDPRDQIWGNSSLERPG